MTTKLQDQQALRERLIKLLAAGVSRRTIANEADVGEQNLSAFRHGTRWGADRLARLDAAMARLEAQLAPPPQPEGS